MKYLLSAALISFAALLLLALAAGAGINNIILAEISGGINYLEKLDNLDIQVFRSMIVKPEINEPPDSEILEFTETGAEEDLPQEISADTEPEEITENNQIIISVLDDKTGGIYNIDLEEYLEGVVFSEMPASFEPDALKAQAVAARSFCVYKMLHPQEEHKGADICNNYRHCKDYISKDAAAEKYGEIEQFWHKIKNAVSETAGEIISYEAEPAVAVFHAMSGSGTESAENVWGNAVPYLTAVPSGEAAGAGQINNYETENRFTAEEFKAILSGGGFDADFPENHRRWLEIIELNSSGRVDYALICGKKISGVRLRELFALRSTDFKLRAAESGDFIFTVKGYGHGVGMSQYGANLMALDGKNYTEILKWYYTGVELSPAYIFFE